MDKPETNADKGFASRLGVLMGDDSYQEFADKIGWTYQSIKRYMEGNTKPSYEFLILIKMKFPTVDLNWLITGEKADSVKFLEEFNEMKRKVKELEKFREEILKIVQPPK